MLSNPNIIGEHFFQSASGLKLIAKQVICEKLDLGGISHRNIKLSIFPNEFEHDTTLGIDVLENTYFSFDSDKKELVCNSNGTLLPNNFTLTNKGHIATDCILTDQSFLGIWDTGAELTVVSKELREKCQDSFSNPVKINNGTDSTGASVDFVLWDVNNFEICRTAFKNIKVLEMNFEPLQNHFPNGTEMIIGFNLIVKANWSFDMKSKTFDFSLLNNND